MAVGGKASQRAAAGRDDAPMPPSSDDGQESLLTKRALAASLSAPRAPPHGSAHRLLLLGKAPHRGARPGGPPTSPSSGAGHWILHHDDDDGRGDSGEEAHSRSSHNTLRQRLWERLVSSHYDAPRSHHPHPHLPAGPELGDRITRFLGVALPIAWQNRCRDSGGARAIFDLIVPVTAPLIALTCPSAVPSFLELSSKGRLERIRYGPHRRHVLDLLWPAAPDGAGRGGDANRPKGPSPSKLAPKRLVVFVHGGAWGSGYPWMYRLVASSFLEHDHVVAIPGYRTYPDSQNVDDQVDDCEMAMRKLAEVHPELVREDKVTLMGHSSGAHVGFLLLVRRIERIIRDRRHKEGPNLLAEDGGQRQTDNNSTVTHEGKPDKSLSLGFDSFVGLSGPYDISHHFDYEAARGVEEFSPMKPVCGYTREEFRRVSPALRLQAALAELGKDEGRCLLNCLSPRFAFVHGVEDETVPFTATAEAARIVRSCGLGGKCCEIYVADTNHQDTVMQLMLGGRTRTAVVNWLADLDESYSSSADVSTKGEQPPRTLLARSKL